MRSSIWKVLIILVLLGDLFTFLHKNVYERILSDEPSVISLLPTSAPPSNGITSESICEWRFVRYRPSKYELHWVENIRVLQGRVCEESNSQSVEAREWIRQAEENARGNSILSSGIFSSLEFRNTCTGQSLVDFIEPLAGLTRSPVFCMHGTDMVNKHYMIVSWNTSIKLGGGHLSRPKAYYFDLGASLYNSGAGGASQSWFVEQYERRGVRWDGIYAWEAAPLNAVDVWGGIPWSVRPFYHWYNVPVNPVRGHPDNPLEFILRVAKPWDFVLLKIDIDNTPVEEAIVAEILGSDTLIGLIDEIYFEHHVNTKPMNDAWGTHGASQTLADSYTIFDTLRRKGVLAHSWV